MTQFIFFGVLILYVVIGLIVTRFVKNRSDFYVMGQRGTTLLIVGTLGATYLSSISLMGIAGQAYAEGPLVVPALGSFGAWLGVLISVLFIGRKMRAMGLETVPAFFENRFKSKAVSTIATIIMIIGLFGYGILDFIGAGLLLSEVTGISFTTMIILFTLAIMTFTVLGGMYGVIVTDTVMFITMLAVSIIIAPLLIGQAGFDAMRNLADTIPGYWTLGGTEERPLMWSISQFLVWILFFAVMPAHISRIFPAKDDFVVLKTGIYAVFLVPLMQVPIFLAAGAMRVLEPNIAETDSVMIVGFLNYTPSPIAGVALAGIMAAIMSTASTIFILIGFALSRDLLESFAPKKLTERQSLILGRITQSVIAILAAIIALTRPTSIYWISIYAGAFFAVGWLPTIVASFVWNRMNRQAAIASMLTGVISFILIGELRSNGFITLPFDLDELIVSFVLSTVVLIVVVLATKPSPYEIESAQKLKGIVINQETVDAYKARPDGLIQMKKQYKQIMTTAIVTFIVSVIIWGFFMINLL